MMRITRRVILLASMTLCMLMGSAAAQGTAFTYQGKLSDNGNLANGTYDFLFTLYDMESGGSQLGTQTRFGVPVSNGSFIVSLDFGPCLSCFFGSPRFLEIAVKPTSGGTFTLLMPRQPITSTPYAIRSQSAGAATTADGLSGLCVNCITSSQIASVAGAQITGEIPIAGVPAGNGNYIQNTTTPQASSNFNISGNGIIGGNVGVGTTTPLGKLHVTGGSVRFDLNSKTLDFSTGSVLDIKARNTGLAISAEGADNNLYLNPNSINGSVTVGTFAPLSKFTVGTASGSYGLTHTDGGVIVGTYVDGTGGWFGTKTNHSLHFFTNNSSPKVTLTGDGNFGIGVSSPTAKLSVSTTTTSAGNNTAYFFAPNIGPNASNIHFGTTGDWYIRSAAATGKVIMQDTGGNVGIGTTAPNSKLQVIGNVTQDMNSGGFVKAMVFVLANGTIARCYNGVTGATTNGCGFSVSFFPQSLYVVDFGFDVSSRFYSLTSSSTNGIFAITGRLGFDANVNKISAAFWRTSDLANLPSDFTLIVY